MKCVPMFLIENFKNVIIVTKQLLSCFAALQIGWNLVSNEDGTFWSSYICKPYKYLIYIPHLSLLQHFQYSEESVGPVHPDILLAKLRPGQVCVLELLGI